jgi:hypothetical protein
MIYFAIMIQYSAGDIYRYFTAITGIKTREKNTVDTDEENKRQLVTGIARALASRSMPPASAFRNPASQSGTGILESPWYRTRSPYFGSRQVPASAFLFIPVPE